MAQLKFMRQMGASHTVTCGKNMAERWNVMCKGPEAGAKRPVRMEQTDKVQ